MMETGDDQQKLYRVPFAQQTWLVDRLESANLAYNVESAPRMLGGLSCPTLRRSPEAAMPGVNAGEQGAREP